MTDGERPCANQRNRRDTERDRKMCLESLRMTLFDSADCAHRFLYYLVNCHSSVDTGALGGCVVSATSILPALNVQTIFLNA